MNREHAVVRACAWSPAGPSSSWLVTTAIYATESPTAPSHVRTCGGPIQHSWTSCKRGLAGGRWRLRTINGSRAVWERTRNSYESRDHQGIYTLIKFFFWNNMYDRLFFYSCMYTRVKLEANKKKYSLRFYLVHVLGIVKVKLYKL
jgi:hypothetical protein